METNETAKTTIIVDSDDAAKHIKALKQEAQELGVAMKNLGKSDPGYEEKKQKLAAINKEIRETKSLVANRLDLIINGQQAGASLKELNAAAQKLYSQLRRMPDTDPEFAKMSARYQELKGKADALNNTIKGTGGFFSRIKDELGAFGAAALGFLGFQFLTSQISNLISKNAKLSDSLADIRRVAGLSAVEVNELNKKLGEIDTRTSTSALREIAIVAGKLGVAKGDIAGFTKEVDKLVVTLGDELGSADQITESLGKILNVFDGKINADNISHLGNAIVELANSGVATGGFIADFTQRLSGVATAANLSLPATVGLGAGLEELGQKVESSSTAISKLIVTIGQDIPKAAKIAGAKTLEEVEAFAKLFAEKPEQALLKFAAGLSKNKASFAEIATSFKDAGEEGARVISTLAQLGQKGEFISQKIDLATEAMKNNNAINDAFALKNQTLGARLDKLGKIIYQTFSNSSVSGFFSTIVNGLTDMLNKTSEAEKAVNDFGTAKKAFEDYEKVLPPIIARYDELKGKSTLTKVEQDELKKIIKQISELIPTAITEFDKYGNAMDINSKKARDFGDSLHSMMEIKNKDALTQNRAALTDLRGEIVALQRAMNFRDTEGDIIRLGKTYGNYVEQIKLTPAEIQKMQKALSEKQTKVGGFEALINELAGVKLYADKAAEAVAGVADGKAPKTDGSGEVEKTQEQKDKLIKTQQDFNDRMTKLYMQLRDVKAQVIKDDEQRELASLAAKLANEKQAAEKELETVIANDQFTGEQKTTFRKATNELLLSLDAKYQTDKSELEDKFQKKRNQEEYNQSVIYLQEWHDKEKLLLSQQLADNAITKTQFDERSKNLEGDYLQYKLQLAKDYGKSVLQIEKDIADGKIKINEDEFDKFVRKEREKLGIKLFLAAEGSQAQLDATIDLIKKDGEEKKSHYENDAEMRLLIDAETNKRIEDARKASNDKLADQTKELYDNFSSAVLNFAQLLDNRENAALEKDKRNNDKKKQNLEKQLNSGVISRENYDRQLSALDNSYNARVASIKKRAWERQHNADILQGIVNTALGVTKASPVVPLMIAVGIAGAAQVALIASQTPPQFRRGQDLRGKSAVVEGPSHTQGGLDVVDPRTGRVLYNIEGKETLLSAETREQNPELVNDLLHASMNNHGVLDPDARNLTSYAHLGDGGDLNNYGLASRSLTQSISTAIPQFFNQPINTIVRERIIEVVKERYISTSTGNNAAAASVNNDTQKVLKLLADNLQQLNTNLKDRTLNETLTKLTTSIDNPKPSKAILSYKDYELEINKINTIKDEATVRN